MSLNHHGNMSSNKQIMIRIKFKTLEKSKLNTKIDTAMLSNTSPILRLKIGEGLEREVLASLKRHFISQNH